MKDRRSVDELTIEELEEIMRVRKREARLERLRQVGKDAEVNGLDPLAPKPVAPRPPLLPTEHRRFGEVGATARYRPRAVDGERTVEKVRSPRRIRWDWLRDKSLLVIEVVLVVGLVAVLLSSLDTLHNINVESSQAQQAQLPTLPAPTPTPLIDVVVLPGGHTPPDLVGTAEIPAHLRDLVDEITPMPLPTPGPEQAIRIQIPSIGVDAPVVEGDDDESLKQGAGHHVGSANPGERGNCIISAHNDIFGEIFRDLPEVELGSEVFVHTASRVYRYVVTQKRFIEPTEVSVMYPTSSPVLTLISCYPYRISTHRIVVIAELKP
ncbi:MAG TPA: class D sortase [Chloroflexi bacterium]|nr:class D sortase [Chloroflexota bacterium]